MAPEFNGRVVLAKFGLGKATTNGVAKMLKSSEAQAAFHNTETERSLTARVISR